MNVYIEPSRAVGRISAPPSKSMAHRALICGALSQGAVIRNIAYSKDITATLECLEKMGAITEKNNDTVKIGGLDLFSLETENELFCNESGSTLRFLLPLCMLSGNKAVLTGSERLFERPLSVYEDICREQAVYFEKNNNAVTVCGKIKSGNYSVPGNISSQFITGLLFVLPLLQGDSILEITEKFESSSYVDMTLYALKGFGIDIKRGENRFYIKGSQKYLPVEYTVEGDCSNAAFLEAFNLLGGDVRVSGISCDTLQGDRVYIDMFRALKKGEKRFDLSDCPDLAPVMFAMAACFGGAEFTGTARLRIKESDRGAVMAEELKKFGVECNVFENSVTVGSGGITKPKDMLFGHNDHRIVMALSVLCSVTGGIIAGAEAVSKSFPDFFEVINRIGIKVKTQV